MLAITVAHAPRERPRGSRASASRSAMKVGIKQQQRLAVGQFIAQIRVHREKLVPSRVPPSNSARLRLAASGTGASAARARERRCEDESRWVTHHSSQIWPPRHHCRRRRRAQRDAPRCAYAAFMAAVLARSGHAAVGSSSPRCAPGGTRRRRRERPVLVGHNDDARQARVGGRARRRHAA